MNPYAEPNANNYPPKGKIITSMIMGILSVSMFWYPLLFSIPCIVFGAVALSLAGSCDGAPEKFRPMLKAARITGTIGLILSILVTAGMIILIVAAASA